MSTTDTGEVSKANMFIPNELQLTVFKNVIDNMPAGLSELFGEDLHGSARAWLIALREYMTLIAQMARSAYALRERGRKAVLFSLMADMERMGADARGLLNLPALETCWSRGHEVRGLAGVASQAYLSRRSSAGIKSLPVVP